MCTVNSAASLFVQVYEDNKFELCVCKKIVFTYPN